MKLDDIYSFALTMFEIFKWGYVYSDENQMFKYHWSIANIIVKG